MSAAKSLVFQPRPQHFEAFFSTQCRKTLIQMLQSSAHLSLDLNEPFLTAHFTESLKQPRESMCFLMCNIDGIHALEQTTKRKLLVGWGRGGEREISCESGPGQWRRRNPECSLSSGAVKWPRTWGPTVLTDGFASWLTLLGNEDELIDLAGKGSFDHLPRGGGGWLGEIHGWGAPSCGRRQYRCGGPGPDAQWFSFQVLVFGIVFVTLFSVLQLICVIYWCVCYVGGRGNYCHHERALICCDVELCVALLCFMTFVRLLLFTMKDKLFCVELNQTASVPLGHSLMQYFNAVSRFFNKKH